MDLGALNLSKFVIWDKYAKYLPENNRKETWDETCDRVRDGLLTKYGHISEEFSQEIVENCEYIRKKQVFGSMRFLQFGGKAVEANNARTFNCSFQPVDAIEAFSENLFLLLSGCGVGYSVETHHISKLPDLHPHPETQNYKIADTIEGWSDAAFVLVSSYLGAATPRPVFDYSGIREKGSLLVTTGGFAPGPEPLMVALQNIERLLELGVSNNQVKLTSLDCHDIMCFLADAVMAGGIRRAAMIALFDIDDQLMLNCKNPESYKPWGEDKINAQRARSNNSAVIYTYELEDPINQQRFIELMRVCEQSGVGEPGIVFSSDPFKRCGYNPCVEASLDPHTFCNLSSIVATYITSQDKFNELAKVAAFLGTLQAGFTDNLSNYLRRQWKISTERDSLIGVSITGVGYGNLNGLSKEEAARCVTVENARVAKIIGINPAARCTLIKPEGSATLAAGLGDCPGVHAGNGDFLLRRCGVQKSSEIAEYMRVYYPDQYEDSVYNENDAFLVFPLKNGKDVLNQNTETAIDFLERVLDFATNWIGPGHRRGHNTHNVSATCRVKPGEWTGVVEFVWANRFKLSGLSFFPASNGASFPQLIYQEITEEEYEARVLSLTEIYPETIWLDHGFNFVQEPACSGNSCEI